MTSRRAFLGGCAALFAAPWARAMAPGSRLAAAWQASHGYQVGILEPGTDLGIRAAIDVPTRAHALLQEPDGTLLALARRPGDWLLRWNADGRALTWRWIEPRRAFTGHVISDGRHLYTCETDLDSGAGLIGVRDAASLEKLAEWPTHGSDPHQLVWDARSHILVANGGVSTQPETGRQKRDLGRMDSSLVRLTIASGERIGQWRLDDRRLSLRHLAWNAKGDTLGIALQAEHDDPESKDRAPVLALFDGDTLRPAATPRSLAGYGGDVAVTSHGFAVSCPRAQGIALFTPEGAWRGFIPLAEACALTTASDRLWAGGRSRVLALNARIAQPEADAPIPDIRLDNHWVILT
jgi:uncharacterized protein